MRRGLGAATVYGAMVALVAPLLPLILWSVAAAWPWPDLLPRTFSGRAWMLLLDPDAGFLRALGTSCGVASMVTAIALIVSLPLARILGLGRFPGKSLLEAVVLLPILVPAFVSAMGLHETLIGWGLADTFAGVVLLHLVPSTPYMVRTLATGYALLGTRLEDQARTLGARPLRVLWSVTLPRLLPAVVLGSTFVFLSSFGEYLLTLLAGGDEVRTLPLVLYPFIAAGDRPIAAMGSLLLCVGPFLTMLLLEKLLARQPLYHRLPGI